jgi:hypothetical protein
MTLAILAPLSWALAGLVAVFVLTREPRKTEDATPVELHGPKDLRPAA